MNIFVTHPSPTIAARDLMGTPKHHSKMATEMAQMLGTAIRLNLGKPAIIDETNWYPKKNKTDIRIYDYALPSESLCSRSPIPLVAYQNHPCTAWVRESWDNFEWALEYAFALAETYKPKTGKPFQTLKALEAMLDFGDALRDKLPAGRTPFAEAFGDAEVSGSNPFERYHSYILNAKSKHMVCEL